MYSILLDSSLGLPAEPIRGKALFPVQKVNVTIAVIEKEFNENLPAARGGETSWRKQAGRVYDLMSAAHTARSKLDPTLYPPGNGPNLE